MCVVCVCVSASASVSVCGDTVTLVVWIQSPETDVLCTCTTCAWTLLAHE